MKFFDYFSVALGESLLIVRSIWFVCDCYMAGDKIYYSLYQKPTVEMRRRHFWEIIEEANHNFTIAQQRGETITVKRWGQVKLDISNE